jgi:hypothetical protein
MQLKPACTLHTVSVWATGSVKGIGAERICTAAGVAASDHIDQAPLMLVRVAVAPLKATPVLQFFYHLAPSTCRSWRSRGVYVFG